MYGKECGIPIREWLVVAVVLPFAHTAMRLLGSMLLQHKEFVVHRIYSFGVKCLFIVMYQMWALLGIYMALSERNDASEQKVMEILAHAMYAGIIAM